MEVKTKHNVGDYVTWESVMGKRAKTPSKIVEIRANETERGLTVSYGLKLSNGREYWVSEKRIVE